MQSTQISLNGADLAAVAGLAGMSPTDAAGLIGRCAQGAIEANPDVEEVLIVLYPSATSTRAERST